MFHNKISSLDFFRPENSMVRNLETFAWEEEMFSAILRRGRDLQQTRKKADRGVRLFFMEDDE